MEPLTTTTNQWTLAEKIIFRFFIELPRNKIHLQFPGLVALAGEYLWKIPSSKSKMGL